jgi:hypothetical protein
MGSLSERSSVLKPTCTIVEALRPAMFERDNPTPPAAHWNAHARRWANLGHPLRPGPQDIARYEAAVAELFSSAPLKALLLGVTPEVACMSWPSGVLRGRDRRDGPEQHGSRLRLLTDGSSL